MNILHTFSSLITLCNKDKKLKREIKRNAAQVRHRKQEIEEWSTKYLKQ
jgi:hypothetical protein